MSEIFVVYDNIWAGDYASDIISMHYRTQTVEIRFGNQLTLLSSSCLCKATRPKDCIQDAEYIHGWDNL